MRQHGNAKCSDEEFIETVKKYGNNEAARRLGMTTGGVTGRRQRLEHRYNTPIRGPLGPGGTQRSVPPIQHSAKVILELQDGVMVVGSDGHYWPGAASTAHKAFVRFIKKFQPAIVVLNGDAFDGARISRHPPIGWEGRPQVIDELEACQERMGEIEQAAPKAKLVWTLGNHDSRFETRLATMAPEFARINGFHLKDHFSERWTPAWAAFINDRPGGVVVKHRYKGGMHAPHNNALWGGRSMVTGHLHSQKVQPITDYNGHRWGVDTGCLAFPGGPQFVDYTEANPLNWVSGFGVFTFKDGQLLPPELVTVWSHERGEVVWRGQIIKV